MGNEDALKEIIKLGKIPANSEITNELFKEYDAILCSFENGLNWTEAEAMIVFFSDDCDDLNWGLLHLIETVSYDDEEKYRKLIDKCNNDEWKEILEIRYNNWKNK